MRWSGISWRRTGWPSEPGVCLTSPRGRAAGRAPGLDRLGVLVAGLAVAGVILPFATFRANRIVPGDPRALWASLPPVETAVLLAVIAGAAGVALWRFPATLRLAASLAVLAVLLVAVGQAGRALTPAGDALARVSPAGGFWVLLATFALLAADALTRLQLRPVWRIAGVAAAACALALLLGSGAWDALSVMKEYATRAPAFWREAQRHVLLAFGSLGLAVLTGVPLGVLCYRWPRLRAGMLNVLNVVQTIPSIAVFGSADRAAGVGRGERAGRGGARHRGHRGRARAGGALCLFAAAGGVEHGDRADRRAAASARRRARHGHDPPPDAVAGRSCRWPFRSS